MNKLVLDGVEYELSEELVEKLKGAVVQRQPEPQCGPFDREPWCKYYYIDLYGDVGNSCDEDVDYDEDMFASGNYCRDEAMMKQRALHETLSRLLWRYSEMHGGDAPWCRDRLVRHFFICVKDDSTTLVDWAYKYKTPGVVYFANESAANAAIEDVVKPFIAKHPEFKW